MVLAIAAEMDWEVLQLDVKTAFLHADIEEEEFVEAAPGFEKTDKHGVQLLMKLGKSLYGRAQSPDNWWKTIDPLLITPEIVRSSLTSISTCPGRTASSSSLLFTLMIFSLELTSR